MGRPPKYDWKNIVIDLEVGLTHAEVHKKYKVPYNSLSNYLKKNPLIVNEQAKSAVEGFSAVNEVIVGINEQQPAHAQAVIDIVVDRHPQIKRAMNELSSAILKRGAELVTVADAKDLKDLAKSMQTVTDTTGISQRFAPRVEKNNDDNDHLADMSEAIRLIHEKKTNNRGNKMPNHKDVELSRKYIDYGKIDFNYAKKDAKLFDEWIPLELFQTTLLITIFKSELKNISLISTVAIDFTTLSNKYKNRLMNASHLKSLIIDIEEIISNLKKITSEYDNDFLLVVYDRACYLKRALEFRKTL